MAVNVPNIARVPFGLVAGDGTRIVNAELINNMYPPQVVVARTILDPSLVTPPSEAYIVPTGATGAWVGQAGKIATSPDNGLTWDFVTPATGDRVLMTKGPNAGVTYRFDGSTWVASVPIGLPVGSLLKMVSYQSAELTLSGTNTDYTLTVPAYTPVSANSKLVIAFDAHILFGSLGADSFRSRILVNGVTQLIEKQTPFINGSGGGGRGASLMPVIASYTNTSLTAKTLAANVQRLSGDDVLTINANRSCVIWEYQL